MVEALTLLVTGECPDERRKAARFASSLQFPTTLRAGPEYPWPEGDVATDYSLSTDSKRPALRGPRCRPHGLSPTRSHSNGAWYCGPMPHRGRALGLFWRFLT